MDNPRNHNNGSCSTVFILATIFAFAISYIFFDYYSQKKSGYSLIQLVKVLNDAPHIKDVNLTSRTYKLFINGEEIVFSFEKFKVQNLQVNGEQIEYEDKPMFVLPKFKTKDK